MDNSQSNNVTIPKPKNIFDDLYLPIWSYHEILSPKFTELLSSIKEKCNGIQIEFNQKTRISTKTLIKEFNSFYDQKSNTLTVTITGLSYYFALHELCHFLTTSNKRKIKKNFGYSSNYFVTGPMSEEEITDEIKTVFLSSIWFNEMLYTNKDGFMFGAIGTKHQFQANNTTYLCSILPFGRYRKAIHPDAHLTCPALKNFDETKQEDIAQLMKFFNEKDIQLCKSTPTNELAYRDPTWDDYLINARCSIKAFQELKQHNFIDENFKLKPIKEWDLQFDFSTPKAIKQ